MRNTSTKERRRDRQELVYMHREFIGKHVHTNIYSSDLKDFVDQEIRPLLSYSVKTFSVDIWLTLQRDFIKLFGYGKW